ncbi:MAG: Eco57I restriction-modification methylase domain-containing protein [Candidatus Pacebacteria bacterium]|nr:Eco57I restriction-modification methylase domain-containing protein [Candidatus Paceibacterota bacterium]
MKPKALQTHASEGNTIKETFSYVIIYVYSIPSETHKGRLKIGKATTTSLKPTQEEIESAARERIKKQTKTADISYTLEHAELAVTNDGKSCFLDTDVHDVLIRSGFPRKSENTKNYRSEWFEVSLEVAKRAIEAVKEGRKALSSKEKITTQTPQFPFRPNQLDAIDKTTKAIKKNRKHFLWNAKMRFGKTSAAMQVAKENKMQKVLIVTHRPSVSVDWYNDFNLVLASAGYEFSSKDKGEDIKVLVKNKKPFVHFASLQDLRLSKQVVEDGSSGSNAKGFEKNEEIFSTTWDMLIIDEAHEGTQSNLGDTTFTKIPTNFTLQLSGTPFNILHKHEEEDIYTWDYVMEQEEKNNWDENYPGIPNPYSELPSLSIFTYNVDTFASHIGSLGENFHDSLDGAFKFHEFFRVHKDEEGNDTSKFVHEPMVKKFLDLLVNDKLITKFPYATQEYRNFNKHSLWLLPNRTEVIFAMEKLLKEHPVFGSFGIVNISGNNYNDDEDKDAKERVTKTIKDNEYTITLTGQRLTTGASIKEWTAVFMMSDTNSATTYLQTAFRCQTPAKIEGKLKTQGYVFDFAPDRTLKLIAEAIELNHKSGKTNSPEQKEAMSKFLNFCPILAAEGGNMVPYDVSKMLTQLKKAIIERVSRNGFDDPKLYNDELLKLDELDIEKFNQLKKIVGNSTSEKINEIKINELGMDDLKTKEAEELERKQKKELSEEEKEKIKKLKEARDQKKSAISILRAVSIRMPMLVYGAHVSIREDINLKKFIELVDEESWNEFMPEGLTKEGFGEFTKYYDEEVFRGVTKSIRAKAFDCDNLLPTDRICAIAEIFSTFKNPDKETVLTPWNVVNKHLTLAFGGHDFSSGVVDKKTGRPEWKSKGVDTSVWEQDDTKILEINSKSGLYPLLAAYNVYSRKIKKLKKPEEKIAKEIWNKVLKENIYVLCKSPMAQSITFRTLVGYNEGIKTNIVYIHELIKKIQQKDNYKDYDLRVELLEKFNLDKDMKFTAVVGNPPYQEQTKDTSDNPIYHLFMDESYKLTDKVALIHPARFLFNAGKTPKEWNQKILNDKHIKVIFYEQQSSKVFPNTDIKGGIAITYRDTSKNFGEIGSFTSHMELNTMLEKVEKYIDFKPMSEIIYLQNKFNLKVLYKDYPGFKKIIGSAGKEKRLTTSIFEQLGIFSNEPKNNDDIKILGLINNKRVYKWISHKYLEEHFNLNKNKVLIPKSNGSGSFGALGVPIVTGKKNGHTQSFLSIGSFENKNEAENLQKYIKTKFLRTMLGVLKITQDNSPRTWLKVPIQDFTNKSDIDWSKSIYEIDKQLYKKYSLEQKEIDFIEKHVKPMT